MAQRLALQDTVRHAVVNEGIGGNTVTRNVMPAPDTTPGTERLDRDVLSHAGVSHVVVFMGTNDIRREASAEQVIDGPQNHCRARPRRAALGVIGVTIVPRANVTLAAGNTGWNDAQKTKARNGSPYLDSGKSWHILRRRHRFRPRRAPAPRIPTS